jgi:hypothetical protein
VILPRGQRECGQGELKGSPCDDWNKIGEETDPTVLVASAGGLS